MRVLVTGSSGLIGSRLVKQLRSHPEANHILALSGRKASYNWSNEWVEDRTCLQYAYDLTNAGWVKEVVADYRPEIIFHLAGHANPKPGDDSLLWYTNVMGTHNLLMATPVGCRFVLASSAAVYGTRQGVQGHREQDATEASTIYAASKIACEALVAAHTVKGSIRGVWPRLVATVGYGARHGCVQDFVRKLYSNDRVLHVIGDRPGSIKPYLHADDAANALIFCGFSKLQGPWNVAPLGDPLSIQEIVETLMNHLDILKPVHWDGGNWPGDQTRLFVSGEELIHQGWRPYELTSTMAILKAATEYKAMTCPTPCS